MDKIYKIKDSIIGLYSKGGSSVNSTPSPWPDKKGNPTYYSFSKKGKIWQSKGGLKAHLRQYCHEYKYEHPIGKILTTYSFYGAIQIKGWWNDIPETWMVEEYDIRNNTVITYQAKSLYPI